MEDAVPLELVLSTLRDLRATYEENMLSCDDELYDAYQERWEAVNVAIHNVITMVRIYRRREIERGKCEPC